MLSIKPKRRLPVIVLGLLTSCAAGNSSPVALPRACDEIALAVYPKAQQARVAREMDAAPGHAQWPSFIRDYGKLRAAVRACQGAKL
jgi:hypothetical protein